MPSKRHRAAALLLIGTSPAVFAGPPFRTDDPEPVAFGHYEMYLFSEGTHVASETSGALPGFEINYGAAPNLQLSAEFAYGYARDEAGWHSAYEASEVGVKYRFVEEDEDGWRPQLGFYPSVEIPGHGEPAATLLPLWAQKTIGDWEIFGGAAYGIHPGREGHNNWFAGIGGLHPIMPGLSAGAEVFHETADRHDGDSETGFNLALLGDLSKHWHLVGSAGRGFTNVRRSNRFSYYLGLELTI